MSFSSFGSFVETDLPQLVELAYDAALDEPRWQNFIDVFSEVFDGATGIMYCLDRQRSGQAADAVVSRNRDRCFSALDAERYLALSSTADHTQLSELVGQVSLAEHSGCLQQNDDRNNDLPATYLRMPLCLSGRRVVMLALAPNTRMLAERRRTYQRRLELLVPHFVRAVKLSVVAEQAKKSQAHSILENFRVCAFVLDAQRRVVAMNRLADSLLCSKKVLLLDRFKQLSAVVPEHAKLLTNAFAGSKSSDPAENVIPITLPSPGRSGGCLIWIIPLRSESPHGPASGRNTLANVFGVAQTDASFLLLACNHNGWRDLSQELLMANFGLSKTEARLSATLASGRTLAEYARENGISRNTARNQLSIVFDKTGVRRQAELVARISRIHEITDG